MRRMECIWVPDNEKYILCISFPLSQGKLMVGDFVQYVYMYGEFLDNGLCARGS